MAWSDNGGKNRILMVLLSRAGASQPTRDCLTAWETTIDPWHGANGPFMAISGTRGVGVGVDERGP